MSRSKPKSPSRLRKAADAKAGAKAVVDDKIRIYDSMGQLSSVTGIPMATIRHASKSGCSAFEHGRVALGPLLRWINKQQDVGGNWGELLKEYQAKREKLRLAKDEARLVDRGAVQDGVAACMAALFGELDRLFTSELPPALKGLDEIAVRDRCQRAIEEVKLKLRGDFMRIGEETENHE